MVAHIFTVVLRELNRGLHDGILDHARVRAANHRALITLRARCHWQRRVDLVGRRGRVVAGSRRGPYLAGG